MKKLLIAIISLVMGACAFAQDGKSIYNKYSDMDGVEAVYISPAMFRMIGKIPDINVGEDDVNIAPLIKSMKGFYVLTVKDPSAGNSLYNDVNQYIKKGDFELILEAKENGEATRIYTAGNNKRVTSFVLISKEKDETSFIAFDGDMDREMLEDALAASAK